MRGQKIAWLDLLIGFSIQVGPLLEYYVIPGCGGSTASDYLNLLPCVFGGDLGPLRLPTLPWLFSKQVF